MDIEPVQMQQVNLKKVPTDLWRRLKIRAAIENATVQSMVAKAIEQYLKSDAA